MDEVICDFIGGACKLHGISRDQLESVRPPGQWDIMGCIADLTYSSRGRVLADISNAGEGFWLHLERLEEGLELIEWAANQDIEWHIVTTPFDNAGSYSGKLEWLKGVFGPSFRKWHPTFYKEIFAGPDTVLIDDKEENCEEFVKNEGQAILWPCQGNKNYGLVGRRLEVVKSQLEVIINAS